MKDFLIMLIVSASLLAFTVQTNDYWWILETTTEESAYDENQQFYWKVTFSESVESLDGKKIRLKGYFYNYQDTSITLFTKNKQPFYGCGADPKIMMIELQETEGLEFKRNKRYILEGTLELNKHYHEDSNTYTFPYKMKACKIIR